MTIDRILGAVKQLIEDEVTVSAFSTLLNVPVYLPQNDGEKTFPCIEINDQGAEPHEVLRGVLDPLVIEATLCSIPHDDGESGTTDDEHTAMAEDLYCLLADIQRISDYNETSRLKVFDVWMQPTSNDREGGRNTTVITSEAVCVYLDE
jgi:hypothetical protein